MSAGGRDFAQSIAQRFAQSILTLAIAVLAGGFISAALVRYSPGFGVDENSWNPQVSAQTAATIHARREYENRLPQFYARYLAAALHGNLGESDEFHAPVADLLVQRAIVSAPFMLWGVAGGMFLGGCLAWLAVWPRRAPLEFTAVSISGLLLAVPPAVMAIAFFFTGAPLGLAVALAILPRVFGTMRALWSDFYQSEALLSARARGVAPWMLAWRYVLLPAAGQLIALTGVSLVLAFGVLTPMEALCDVPGIGWLTWKAAVARDLPLLCGLALVITFIVALVATIGEWLGDRQSTETA